MSLELDIVAQKACLVIQSIESIIVPGHHAAIPPTLSAFGEPSGPLLQNGNYNVVALRDDGSGRAIPVIEVSGISFHCAIPRGSDLIKQSETPGIYELQWKQYVDLS